MSRKSAPRKSAARSTKAAHAPTFETFAMKVAQSPDADWFIFTLQQPYVDASTGVSHPTVLVPSRLVHLLEPEGQFHMLEEGAFLFEIESENRVRTLRPRPPLFVEGWQETRLGQFYS